MRLILIRHGETLWNETKRFQGISDIKLSPRGMAQARCLALSLGKEPLAAIYASPLLRARQTAECIAVYHSCRVVEVEGLRELNQGELEGLTGTEVRKDYPQFMEQWLNRPGETPLPGGESLADLQRRTWIEVETMIRKHTRETLAVVAHSFVNLTILCRVLDLPLNSFRHLRQDPAAKTTIDFTERGAVLRCLNDTCHLDGIREDGFPPAGERT